MLPQFNWSQVTARRECVSGSLARLKTRSARRRNAAFAERGSWRVCHLPFFPKYDSLHELALELALFLGNFLSQPLRSPAIQPFAKNVLVLGGAILRHLERRHPRLLRWSIR